MPTNPRTSLELITSFSLNTWDFSLPLPQWGGGRMVQHSLEGLSSLWPLLPGKAIKATLFYCTQNCLSVSLWHQWTEAEFWQQNFGASSGIDWWAGGPVGLLGLIGLSFSPSQPPGAGGGGGGGERVVGRLLWRPNGQAVPHHRAMSQSYPDCHFGSWCMGQGWKIGKRLP